jgi:hypothetical protein
MAEIISFSSPTLLKKTMVGPFFYQNGTEREEGSSCPSQNLSLSKGCEGQEGSTERCPYPQKEDMHVTHLPVA